MDVLLLNASGEILDVRPWQKAMKLVAKGKAHRPSGHEEHYDIKVPDGVLRLPTALMLGYYVHVPYKKIAVNKDNVLRRDAFECQYCGLKLTSGTGTIDHIHPQSRGGRHRWSNVVAACKKCNNRKDNKTPDEAGMKLMCRPFVPTRDVMVLHAKSLRTHKEWTKWIMT